MDPAAGTAMKFATHPIPCDLGGEYLTLATIAAAAGVAVNLDGQPSLREMPSAAEAGRALRECRRLGILLAAEYGRAAAWRQIGYLAGKLAEAAGGGLALQTTGANTLAAVRLGTQRKTLPLSAALSDDSSARVAIGCDVLSMLGRKDIDIVAAAAALPNATTDAAEIVLPLAMPGEMEGTYLLNGTTSMEVSPLLAAPAGVPTAADLMADLASKAGVAQVQISTEIPTERLMAEIPIPAVAWQDPAGPVLLLSRQAHQSGCGSLTKQASWQRAGDEIPSVRISPQTAAELNLPNLAVASICAGEGSFCGRLQYAPELPAGRIVVGEGLCEGRAILSSKIDQQTNQIVSEPVTVQVSC